jgi:hypothetical protein
MQGGSGRSQAWRKGEKGLSHEMLVSKSTLDMAIATKQTEKQQCLCSMNQDVPSNQVTESSSEMKPRRFVVVDLLICVWGGCRFIDSSPYCLALYKVPLLELVVGARLMWDKVYLGLMSW